MKRVLFLVVVALTAAHCFAEAEPFKRINLGDASKPPQWRVSPFGNPDSIEIRVLRLGPNGGAIGGYVGLTEDYSPETGDVVAAGAIGTWDIIQGGQFPVANLFPRFLGLEALLPETVPVDLYLGGRLGFVGLKVEEDEFEETELTAGLLSGIVFGLLALEAEVLFDQSVWSELAPVTDDWEVRLGLPVEF